MGALAAPVRSRLDPAAQAASCARDTLCHAQAHDVTQTAGPPAVSRRYSILHMERKNPCARIPVLGSEPWEADAAGLNTRSGARLDWAHRQGGKGLAALSPCCKGNRVRFVTVSHPDMWQAAGLGEQTLGLRVKLTFRHA